MSRWQRYEKLTLDLADFTSSFRILWLAGFDLVNYRTKEFKL